MKNQINTTEYTLNELAALLKNCTVVRNLRKQSTWIIRHNPTFKQVGCSFKSETDALNRLRYYQNLVEKAS